MSQETKPALKINYWFLVAAGIIILSSAATTFMLFTKANVLLSKNLTETAEKNRPALLHLTLITDKSCTDCFNLKPVIDFIKKENVKIDSETSVDSSSDEGKKLITKFGIKKLPTFTVQGEVKKNTNLNQFFSKAGEIATGDIADDTFVFRQVGGPYVDTASGKVKGRINLVLLTDITCTECYDVTQHETILKQFGMEPATKVLDVKSAAGSALASKYGIKLVPTFVLSGDVKEYPSFTAPSVWPQVGIVAKDGAYVFTKGVPLMGVYKDLTTNKVIKPAPASTK